MIRSITLCLCFSLLCNSFVIAGCGGPILSSTYFGHCPNGTPAFSGMAYVSADTVTTYAGPADTIHFLLQAGSDCDPFDSVQWYKDGTLLYQAPSSSLMYYSYAGCGPGTYTCKFKMHGWIFFTIYYPATALTVASAKNENSELNVFPNPSHGLFNVNTGKAISNCTVSISDCSGRVIRSIKSNEEMITIDLSDLSPGFYSLVLIDDKGRRRSKKIIYN